MDNLDKAFLIKYGKVVGLPSANPQIDDTQILDDNAWSSQKTSEEIAEVESKIDGTTIKTTSTTGSEYYAITFKDKQFERGSNQGILIQHNRLNFEPSTFIFSASSYSTVAYERDNYDVTKINGSIYNPTSPYMIQFYMDKTNNTLYLSVPSYSGVTLTDLQFKSDAIAYTKVDAIPDTATKITITEYATKEELKTSKNVEPTNLTFNGDSSAFNFGAGNHYYITTNGVCYFQVYARVVAYKEEMATIISGLPKPKKQMNFSISPYVVYDATSYKSFVPLRCELTEGGTLKGSFGYANNSYFVCGSYPIA